MEKYQIGIDEVGRGPLAGPVAVGAALVTDNFDWDLLPGVTDSKKLSEKKREEIYKIATELAITTELDFAVSMISAKIIDQTGIILAIEKAMNNALQTLEKRHLNTPVNWSIDECRVLLDGGLKAPKQFMHQETIVKGDSKEKVIGLASIMAKVTRDRYMRRQAKLAAYTPYDFSSHKGYGTKAHRAAIAKYGLTDLHRSSYCGNIIML